MKCRKICFVVLVTAIAFEGSAAWFVGPINFSFSGFGWFWGNNGNTNNGNTNNNGNTGTVTGCFAIVPLILKLLGWRPTCNSNTVTTTTTPATCPAVCSKFVCDNGNVYCNPARAASTGPALKCTDATAVPVVGADPAITVPCNNARNSLCVAGNPGCPTFDCPDPDPPGSPPPPTLSLC